MRWATFCAMLFVSLGLTGGSKQLELKPWNIPSTASTIAAWVADILFAKELNIQTIVLSVREDGVFLGAGSVHGVTPGLVFEVYRAAHDRFPEEIAGKVRVAWTREDYCFAEPEGSIDLSLVSTLHFARLVRLPPELIIEPDITLSNQQEQVNLLIDAERSVLSSRGVRVLTRTASSPVWRLVLAPDDETGYIGVSLISPSGEAAGNTLLNPHTGARLSIGAWLEPGYFSGTVSPFEHYLASPARRAVRIAAGNIVAGSAGELVVLDGNDLYLYDTSGPEPILLHSFSVNIPAGGVRHREDAGSLELVDLDGNGLDEVCISPPAGTRGEIWSFDGNDWVHLGFLPSPPRSVAAQTRAVLVSGYLDRRPALNPSTLSWFFPLTSREPARVALNFVPLCIATVPQLSEAMPDIAAVSIDGTLLRISASGQSVNLGGSWGSPVECARTRDREVAILTSPSLDSDELTIVDLASGSVLAAFPCPDGLITDIAVGDIDKDGKSEILVAVIHREGVRIYY